MIADESLSAEEIVLAEKYMREKPLDENRKRQSNRTEMLQKFKQTRKSRRDFLTGSKASTTTFLNKYPRLKDMKEAVSCFFMRLLVIEVNII